MLEIVIPTTELFNEYTGEFLDIPATKIKLEHSLLSISKWEAKYKRPFLSKTGSKTSEEMRDYIRMMTVSQNINPMVYAGLTAENVKAIEDYIDDTMTATIISDKYKQNAANGRDITSELVYCWMVQLGIPFECQKWHIQRLLTLINVCSLENQPPKKMDRTSTLKQNAALNRMRRQAKKG